MNNPLVSVITVVFNGEKHIEQTINSVICQSYLHFEYIIIDGASTDGTLEIIKKYEKNITHLVSEKDTGIYNAMNKGLALAKGEIIGILNADDYYYEKTIELVVQTFIKSEAEIIYGDLVKLRSFEGKNYFKELAPNISLIEKTMPIFHPATFVKKTVYNKIGNFNEKYKLSADYDFIYRAYNAKITFEYLPQPLTVFRIDGATSMDCKSYKEGYKILSSYGSPYDSQMRKLIFKCRIKNVVRFFGYLLLKLFGLKKWYEKRLVEKWR